MTTINALQNLSQIFINRLGANNTTVELDTETIVQKSESLIQLADKTARNAITNGKRYTLTQCHHLNGSRSISIGKQRPCHDYSTGETHRVIVVAPK